MITSPEVSVTAAVTRYADAFHAAVPPGHHVASPLGAWLMLALVAPAARGRARADLSDVLGMDPEEACAAAAALLADPHPAVAAAAAVWSRPELRTEQFDRWRAGLPAPVTRGPVPSQDEADAWARDHTLGLIDRFPLELTPQTVLLLSTALASTIVWRQPFATAPAQVLGGAWADRVSRVLLAPDAHEAHLVNCGEDLVGLHAAFSDDGLCVVSVIAQEAVPRRRVLSLAHRLGAGWVGPGGRDLSVGTPADLFALPLGRTGFVTVAQTDEEVPDAYGRTGGCRVTMPAWEADTSLDLMGTSEFGFLPAADALVAVLPPRPDYRTEARHSALARYGKDGFQAAAMTSLSVDWMERVGPFRTADIRFEHPYAVVAFATRPAVRPASPERVPSRPLDTGSSWDGLPVFSAWIESPADTDE